MTSCTSSGKKNNQNAMHRFGCPYSTLSGAIEGENVVALRGILDAGHSPEEYEWDTRSTPLIQATQKKNLEVMSILLHYGANISNKHKDGYTAVHVASVLGFLKGLEILSVHGADFNEPDKDNLTPLCLAASEGHVDVVHYLFHRVNSIQPECGNFLLTPLIMAALMKQVEVVNFLLHVQEKSAYQELELNKALLQATIQGNEEVVCLLLEHGANPNCQNDLPPIHAAIHKGYQKILEILCDNGADIEIRNSRDFTPLITACLESNIPAVQYLLKIGANMCVSFGNKKYSPLKMVRRESPENEKIN
ncbi:unnamed protein product [Hymenolepis diminuta]|uniref:Uncharacterized protein n=1 Tax=Hymenolepis diminuta TaxID=6216 RepID=A0A564YDG1_HYMDI|nr:unnamed protein product [Hymenolepis diminuta]